MRFKYAKCVGMSPLPPKRTLGTTVGMSTLCQFQPLAILHSYAYCRYKREMPTERSIVPRNELAA